MECSFRGLVLLPGEKVPVTAEYDEEVYETLHFTQAALGEKAKAGPHTIFVEKDGQRFAIGTLDAARCPQFSCDITLALDEVVLSHSGPSEVHLTGYAVQAMMMGQSSDDEEGRYARGFGSSEEDSEDEDEEEEEEEDSEEEDEEAPAAVPLKLGGKPVKPRARMLVDDEAEEGSSSEEEDGEEEEDDSEDEGLPMSTNGKRIMMKMAQEDSSEEEELSSGEEEEEEEESEEEEERPAPAPKQKQQKEQQQQGAKRPAPAVAAAAAKTPQPAKKAKVEQQQKAPATAPAKVPAAKPAAAAAAGTPGPAAPANEKEYLAALKAALQQGGALKLATLGTKVKRPPAVPKVKHFLDKHPEHFKYDKDSDMVTLA